MIPIIIIVLSLFFDGLLTNYLPFLVNDLSLFTPLLTIVSIFMIYPYFRKELKKYFIIVASIGIIYDLLYTNLLFFNAILFLLIAIITRFIYKNYEITFFRLVIYIILIIVIYESATALILLIFNLVPITISKLLYKIYHSLILNIIYGELIYLVLKLLPKKYKKISIN